MIRDQLKVALESLKIIRDSNSSMSALAEKNNKADKEYR